MKTALHIDKGIPGSSIYVKCLPFGSFFWWKGTDFTHSEDPGIYIYIKDMIPTNLSESFFDFFNIKKQTPTTPRFHVSVGIITSPSPGWTSHIKPTNCTSTNPRRAAPRCQSWDLRFCWRLPWRSLESWLCEARGDYPPVLISLEVDQPWQPTPPEIRV